MNDIFFSYLSGMNIVVGCAIIAMLFCGFLSTWKFLSKLGLFIMATGLLGQAAFVITGTSLSAPFWEQFWALKDIGLAVFTMSLVKQFIDRNIR
jgi:hypothetical protein